MNVDEAMESAAEFKTDPMLFAETVAVVLAAEVERLRAELKVADKWLHERSEAYGKTCSMVDQLQTELAAAKAASVVTDEESQKAFQKWLEYECWECHRSICEATWKAAIKWMKERGEG